MRKVDVNLIEELNRGAENQTVKNVEPATQKITYVDAVDYSYDKGHNVVEGVYLVKLLEIKCHNKNCYWVRVEILGDDTTQVITGYAGRDSQGYYDLADCFSNGVLHSKTKDYVGGAGYIVLSHSGWITLLSRSFDSITFPNFKVCARPARATLGFDEYCKRFE